MRLEGQIALVTGASRGIGAAIAASLGRNGAMVVGTATTEAGAERIGREFEQAGVRGSGMVLDVAKDESVQTLFGALKDTNRLPTILVNNAGITRDNLLIRMSEQEWCEVIDANLSSLFRMCRMAAKSMMKSRRGRIINIASVVGETGNPGQTNYAAAKAGMMGFTRALARELGSRGVTVNNVAPGFIDTDMTRALSEEQRESLLGQIPLRRLGAGDDVAAAVVFLAGPGAAYITGETLHVNGGMYMG